MTFYPQSTSWSVENFNDPEGAEIIDANEIGIVSGAVSLLPTTTTDGVFSFDGAWNPVANWDFNNRLNTIDEALLDFNLVTGEGVNGTSLYSQYLTTDDSDAVCYYTYSDPPVLIPDSPFSLSGLWVSGATSCFTHSLTGIDPDRFVLELSVRAIEQYYNYNSILGPSALSGTVGHGIYIATSGAGAFIEVHPQGLKVHKYNGALLRGDFTSSLRAIRIIKSNKDLLIMTDNGESLYVSDAFIQMDPSINGNSDLRVYISFGAPKVIATTHGSNPSSLPMVFQNLSGSFFEPSGLTGIAGFGGMVLWDDIKLKKHSTAGALDLAYYTTWPSGEKKLYTSPWIPSPALDRYGRANLKVNPLYGGETKVGVQYYSPSSSAGTGVWTDFSGNILFTENSRSNASLDIRDIPFYNGFENKLRFLVAISGDGSGPCSQVDQITVMGKNGASLVDVVPNWKLSNLPKDISFNINAANFNTLTPVPMTEDEIFINNDLTQSGVGTGEYLLGPESYLASGKVLTDSAGLGLSAVQDGVYGAAVSNLVFVTGFSGFVFPNTASQITTGVYFGNLLDGLIPYPHPDSPPAGAESATVVLETEMLQISNNENVLSQIVTVNNYTGASSAPLGVMLSGLSGPAGSNYVGVIKGVVQIPNGTRLAVTMYRESDSVVYYLDGHEYRTPKEFGIAMPYGASDPADVRVSFGVEPLPQQHTLQTAVNWGPWAEEINANSYTRFMIHSLNGGLYRHSYLEYSVSGNPARYSLLDSNPIYETVSYSPVRRDSLIFEGRFRPYGLTGTNGTLFKSMSPDNRGLELSLNKSGELSALVHLNTYTGAIGGTGSLVMPVGQRNGGVVTTGVSSAISLTSNSNTVLWGSWNTIGVYQDTRTLGDTYTAANQPLIADTDTHHGARSSRLYMMINNRIVNSIDTSIDGYIYNTLSQNSVTPSYPTGTAYVNTWPKISIYATSGDIRTGALGQGVMCDFDHVRFGIREKVDAMASTLVTCGKATPPFFSPYNAIKVRTPTSGSVEHYQYAHIYRFNYPASYQGWDEGFSPSHIIFPHYTSNAVLNNLGIKPNKFFIRKTDDGPKGYSALRIGPGGSAYILPHNYDDRLFNGTGSASLANSTFNYFYNSGKAWIHGDLSGWATGFGRIHETSANSRVVMGGKFRVYSLPTGAFHQDLFSFEEVGTSYGTANIYIGVNSNSQIVYGTRRVTVYDGSQGTIGQFTGHSIQTGEWFSVGLDANVAIGSGYMKIFTGSSTPVSQQSVTINTVGGSSSVTGKPLGYNGSLGASTTVRSSFVIGGEFSKTTSPFTYPYTDMDVSECFIGFPLSGFEWPWAEMLSMSDNYISGHTDVAIKNSDIKIMPVVGTGNSVFYNGIGRYPATPYSEAGEHFLWTTSVCGNDFESVHGFGVPLYSNGLFNNAEAYYVQYGNDNITQAFGSTDSPVTLGNVVPPNGVNLALLSNKEWAAGKSVTLFDMSDNVHSNVINKSHGDTIVSNFFEQEINGISTLISSGTLPAPNVRVSSIPLWSLDNSDSYVGYFSHLIGDEKYNVYIPNTYPHSQTTGDYSKYYFNIDKVYKSINVKDTEGNLLSFAEFPYTIYVTPYAKSSNVADLPDDMLVYNASTVDSTLFNPDHVFTCIVVANKQSIGKTVFISYPAASIDNTSIDLQHSEIYNPIPVIKETLYDDIHDIDGSIDTSSVFYTIKPGREFKKYDLTIWNTNFTGWAL